MRKILIYSIFLLSVAGYSQTVGQMTTYCRFIPERMDDFAWENDRVAFRVYGPECQKLAEQGNPAGLISSGIDCWLKRVDYPIIDKWYQKASSGGSYHQDDGEGLDNFHVGKTRGCGGTAIFCNGDFVFSQNFSAWEIIENSAFRSVFRLKFKPVMVKGIPVSETKTITIKKGDNFFRCDVEFESELRIDTLAIGLTLHDNKGVTDSSPDGWITYWQPIDDSEIGMAAFVSKKDMLGSLKIENKGEAFDHIWLFVKPKNNKATYYAGFGWKKSGQFASADEWKKYIEIMTVNVNAQSVYDKASIKAVMDKVNHYQYTHPWKDFDDNWVRGTYYTGVMACYQATGDKAYLNQCNELGDKMQWRVCTAPPTGAGGGGNLITLGQTWLESYMIDKKKYKIKPLIDHLDNPEINNPVSRPLNWYYESGRRYVDGLFTGPPTLAMLYSITKNEKYLQWMDAFCWDIYGCLYDEETNLFYRDFRFYGQKTPSGKKIIWSRGNGWAFAALARILKYLPKDYATYSRYVQLYRNMASALKNCQSEEGFWYPNLDDPTHFPYKETSGTAFFTYGFAYGINTGILDKNEYLPVVEKAWKSLYEAVSDEGKLQWGQIVGDRPVEIKKEDSHEYVSGTFLLAASEVYKLAK